MPVMFRVSTAIRSDTTQVGTVTWDRNSRVPDRNGGNPHNAKCAA
jgi:hypothetical protein